MFAAAGSGFIKEALQLATNDAAAELQQACLVEECLGEGLDVRQDDPVVVLRDLLRTYPSQREHIWWTAAAGFSEFTADEFERAAKATQLRTQPWNQ
eukprot:3298075-Pyramimonas_sp.AAC.1